jgi:hypothetical protein
MFYAPEIILGCTEGVGSNFHVLRSPTHYGRYRGCQVQFSCFMLLDSFSMVTRASVLIFMFCAPELVFDGTEGSGSSFHGLRSRTHFRQLRGSQVQFLRFAHMNSFSALPRASGPVFMFCAPRLVFDDSEGVRSNFNILHTRTHFWLYKGCRVQFSCFALLESFSTV